MQQMTAKQIDEILEVERQKFNDGLYEGIALPSDIMELLEKTLFKASGKMLQQPNGISYYKKVLEKTKDELTNFDVAVILNVINTGQLSHLYKNLKEGLRRTELFETIRLSYNIIVKKFEETLMQKQSILSGKKLPNNMSIIQN